MDIRTIALCAVQVPFVRGGAELQVVSLRDELVKRGFEVDVVSIPFKWYPRKEILKHALLWRLLDLSESNGKPVDLVIPTKFPSYLIKHPNKVTWLIHQFRQVYDQYGTRFSDFDASEEDTYIREKIVAMDNGVLPESRRIFAESRTVAQRLKHFNNIESEPLYHPPRHVGRYRCDSYDGFVLSVGRLDMAKRVDLLLKALAYTDSAVRCIVAGEGPDRGRLEKIAEAEGLTHRTEFLGFVDEETLIDLYAKCFCVYYAPFEEDYGYVTLEAFLSSKPVVTTEDSGGVLEFVEDQANGVVCELDAAQIGEGINRLFEDRSRCSDLGAQGFERVKDIRWDTVIEQLTS